MAKLRLSAAVAAKEATSILGPAKLAATRREGLTPEDRMSMAYAQGDAEGERVA